jgi:acyl-CoA thioesterase
MTPETRATKAAAAMWAGDEASKWLGMQIVSVTEGAAELTLTVAPHHANGHGICHGGITFALADSAFAFACNSRNQSSVAQINTITYLAPARINDILTAQAREISLTGRNGIYDVTISTQTGAVVAEFRGHSRTIAGQHFAEEETP